LHLYFAALGQKNIDKEKDYNRYMDDLLIFIGQVVSNGKNKRVLKSKLRFKIQLDRDRHIV